MYPASNKMKIYMKTLGMKNRPSDCFVTEQQNIMENGICHKISKCTDLNAFKSITAAEIFL